MRSTWFPLSRRAVAFAALALILVLDLARSILVREAMQTSASVWKPDPSVYADTVWPPAAGAPAHATPAQKLYAADCAICHGPDGRGNGASAPSMIPRPRDFTQGQFKYKTTPAGAPPSDDDLYATVADGLKASGMPAWRDLLSAEDIRALVGVVKSMSPVFAHEAPAPIVVPVRVNADAASLERGRKLYGETGCAQCHGDNLRGGVELKDAKGYPVISRDLTAPWTFRGGDAPETLWLRLTTGLSPGPMPSFAEALTADQRWDVVNYVISTQRAAPWAPGGALQGPGTQADLAARGRYLVHAEMCGLCHTEVDASGIYREDRYLAGGMRVGAEPQGVFVSRNLTSDVETGLGGASVEQIADAIRDGKGLDGHTLNIWGMPWMYLHALKDDDATAIATYLKTLPAAHNQIPETLHGGFVETIARKLIDGGFPAAPPPTLTYSVGSFANLPGVAPARIQSGLIDAQWAVLLLALLATPFAAPGVNARPSRFKGALKLLGLGVAILLGGLIYALPSLSFMPPERMAEGAAGSIPKPDVSTLAPERAAMVTRGRYLYNVASCAYCHGNDGSGGAKLSGGVRENAEGSGIGTIFTANISSDKDAGLSAWSDDQIARAIRSGVSRDGRPLYWQGMPWDHFSNWDEEDIRSLVAYLRLLPAVAEKVPAYRPPAPDDCPVYTFWTHKTREMGCRG